MTDEAFLRAIQSDPDDDTNRLVYADWLEERGDPRGEYLRLQALLAQTQSAQISSRLWELRAHIDLAWLTAVGKGRRFGDRRRFAVEVGEFYFPDRTNRRVDLWAASRWLTCDDHNVRVGQFRHSVEHTIGWLRSGPDLALPFPGLSPEETFGRLYEVDDGLRERFWGLLRWGPTTDNVSALLFRHRDHLVITFQFWRDTHPNPEERGVIFVAELPESELLEVLEQLRDALQDGR
jgi:uncharacterized protein (TIGR02996 family)